jgi:hypothetical protein
MKLPIIRTSRSRAGSEAAILSHFPKLEELKLSGNARRRRDWNEPVPVPASRERRRAQARLRDRRRPGGTLLNTGCRRQRDQCGESEDIA